MSTIISTFSATKTLRELEVGSSIEIQSAVCPSHQIRTVAARMKKEGRLFTVNQKKDHIIVTRNY